MLEQMHAHSVAEPPVQVTYKRTRWLDDQVLLSGFAAGGLTEVPREAFHSCSLAITLALELGHLGLKPEVCPLAHSFLP